MLSTYCLFVCFASSGRREQIRVWEFGALLLLPVLGSWAVAANTEGAAHRSYSCLFQTNQPSNLKNIERTFLGILDTPVEERGSGKI